MNLYPAAATQLINEFEAPPLVTADEPLDELTVREGQVLALIARGYSNAAIAEALTITEATAKTHVKHVLAKLGVHDRTQAAIYAYETRFVMVGHQRPAAPRPVEFSNHIPQRVPALAG